MRNENIDISDFELRKSSAIILNQMIDFTSFVTKELDIDAIDWQVLACVAYYSAKAGDLFKTEIDFEKESIGYTNGVVITKTIHLTLGMPRETVRKRLVYLETRGFIKKEPDGYRINIQHGSTDFAENLRKFLFSQIAFDWNKKYGSKAFPTNININSNGMKKEIIKWFLAFINMVSFCTNELKIDPVEWQVLSYVFSKSALNGYLFKENSTTYETGIITAESIQTALNMPRETVRKKLIYLESRGFIKKEKGGYAMVPQYGEDDQTNNIRKYIEKLIVADLTRKNSLYDWYEKKIYRITKETCINGLINNHTVL